MSNTNLNAFLTPALRFIDACLQNDKSLVASFPLQMYYRDLEAVKQLLETIEPQAAYCPSCSEQFDAAPGYVAPPTVVRKRNCGHYCCDKCVRACADGGCSYHGCSDCMPICEGCAEPHCHEHQVAKNYCKECVPREIEKQLRCEEAVIED